MLTTTLNEILEVDPCQDCWKKLLRHLCKTQADDDPINFYVILESNGVLDAFFCLRALPEEMDDEVRFLACLIAEKSREHIPEGASRALKALEVAGRALRGEATEEELSESCWEAEEDAREAARRSYERPHEERLWQPAWASAWAACAVNPWSACDASAAAAFCPDGSEAWSLQKSIFLDWLRLFDEQEGA